MSRHAVADRADPRLGDRRRRGARRAVRPPPPRLRRLHRLRSRAVVRRGLHPRARAAAVRQHAHRGLGHRAPDDRAAGGGARGSSTRAVNGGAEDVVVFCGSGATAAIDKLDPAARPGVGGRVHRALRAPLQRAAVAGVRRGRRHDPRGRRRADRRRAPRGRARAPRGPGAEGRELLGRLERDRDRLRRRADRGACSGATARSRAWTTPRPGRTCRSTWPARTRSSSRPTSSPAARGRPGVLVAKRSLLRRPRAVGARRGHGRVRQPDARTATTRTRRCARRRARRRSSSRSAPGWCSRSRRRSAPSEIRRREGELRPPRARVVGREPEPPHPRQPGARAARDRLARRPPPARDAALELRRRAAQRPVRDPGAQRMLLRRPVPPPPAIRSTPRGRRRCTRRRCAAVPGAKLAFARLSFHYFISEAVFDYIVEAVHLIAERGLEAAAAVPLRPRHRPLAARDRRRRPRPLPDPRRACGLDRPDRARERARAAAGRGAADPRRHGRRAAARAVDAALPAEFERRRWFPLPGEVASGLAA